ncbi:hypothetical protein CLU79DRAFT_774602 [Phycomyces nitens]|nr:hypothetical protein CLU79DRAFT_774602 [Phycomyces nitens]
MSLLTIIIVLCVLPTVPLLIYVIGLLLPASHIVFRTVMLDTTPEKLWKILTNVQAYPSWQPKLESVTISAETHADQNRLVFTEYSKQKKRTIIHVEQEPQTTLVRILEERSTSAERHKSTFSGSWTFEIQLVDTKVMLKITEQGVIKKPMIRVSHMLLFGFHLRIDRFIKDLVKKIQEDNLAPIPQPMTQEMASELEDEEKMARMEHSRLLDNDWDLMSEVYEKTNQR